MTRTNRWLVCLVALLFVAGGTIASATRLSARGEQTQGIAAKPPETVVQKSAAVANAEPPEKTERSMLIHVLGPDGSPWPGSRFIGRSGPGSPSRMPTGDYVSDEHGQVRVELPEDIYIFRLWARAKGYVPLFAHWEEDDNPEKSLPAEFTFRLQTGTVIGGVVRDSDGEPIKGVSVEVMLERGWAGRRTDRPRHVAGRARSITAPRRSPTTKDDGRSTMYRRVTISSFGSSSATPIMSPTRNGALRRSSRGLT